MCDHIIGYEEGVDESWLVYQGKGWGFGFRTWFEFTFCPLCGERLKEG